MSRYRTLAFKSLAGLALIRGSASDQIESNGWFVLLSLYGHLSLQCIFSKSSESPNDSISSILTRTSIIFCCSSLKAVSNWKLIGKHQKSLFIYYSLISVSKDLISSSKCKLLTRLWLLGNFDNISLLFITYIGYIYN